MTDSADINEPDMDLSLPELDDTDEPIDLDLALDDTADGETIAIDETADDIDAMLADDSDLSDLDLAADDESESLDLDEDVNIDMDTGAIEIADDAENPDAPVDEDIVAADDIELDDILAEPGDDAASDDDDALDLDTAIDSDAEIELAADADIDAEVETDTEFEMADEPATDTADTDVAEPELSAEPLEVAATAGDGNDGQLTLDAILDLRAATPLVDALKAKRGAPIDLDASQVERLGALCLQVLLSAKKTWDADDQPLTLSAPSETFLENLSTLGVSPSAFEIEEVA